MEVVNDGLSKELQDLLLKWEAEHIVNTQHDFHEMTAWNALVNYLMDLERKAGMSNGMVN